MIGLCFVFDFRTEGIVKGAPGVTTLRASREAGFTTCPTALEPLAVAREGAPEPAHGAEEVPVAHVLAAEVAPAVSKLGDGHQFSRLCASP